MDAVCWSDYLCPWCYVGQHREGLLRARRVGVTMLPYELHPEIGPEGRRVRPDGRLQTTFERIEAECDQVGMPFRRPTRMPNTRRALETAEWTRTHHPDAFEGLHAALFGAQFVTGDPIDDPEVLDELVRAAGAPAADVRDAVDGGHARAGVDDAMARARQVGVTSTPSWLLGDDFVVPGVPDTATLLRWVDRLMSRD